MIPGIKTPKFSLCGVNESVRVVDVYDGDSLMIVMPCFGEYVRFPLRIDGIDTCELNSTACKTKQLALDAKAMVFKLITGQTLTAGIKIRDYLDQNYTLVTIGCKDFDKYGRLLAHVTTRNGDDLAAKLIECKLATAYHGGKKLSEDEQIAVLS